MARNLWLASNFEQLLKQLWSIPFPRKTDSIDDYKKALKGEAMPVYGAGNNVRDWLYVDDHARALYEIASKGRPGESYNVGGNSEVSNIEVVKTICTILDELSPKKKTAENTRNKSLLYQIDQGTIFVTRLMQQR